MVFPEALTVHNYIYALDGGTTVLQANDDTGRERVVMLVRLGRMLGDGLQGARRLLNSETPLAEGATALEVLDVAQRYHVEGLTLRIEPAFRWRPAESTISPKGLV